MSVVTKTGDAGETSLFNGERVPKDHPRIEAVGLLDELNSHIGLLRSEGADAFIEDLKKIQDELFEAGAMLAQPDNTENMNQALSRLEESLNRLEATLPPLTQFVLPGGHPLAAQTHVARSMCRRAERALSAVDDLSENLLPYLNRLSDYLFLGARHINLSTKTDEVLWTQM